MITDIYTVLLGLLGNIYSFIFQIKILMFKFEKILFYKSPINIIVYNIFQIIKLFQNFNFIIEK